MWYKICWTVKYPELSKDNDTGKSLQPEIEDFQKGCQKATLVYINFNLN